MQNNKLAALGMSAVLATGLAPGVSWADEAAIAEDAATVDAEALPLVEEGETAETVESANVDAATAATEADAVVAAIDLQTSYAGSFTFSDAGVTAAEGSTGYKVEGTTLTINEAGTYLITGSCSEGNIKVKKGTTGVTLVLQDLSLVCSTTAPLAVNKTAQATILVQGSVTLSDNEDIANDTDDNEDFEGAAIKVKSDAQAIIAGSGTLTVNGACKNGIKGGDGASITVRDLTLNVTAANDGLSSDGELNVESGTVKVSAGDDGVKSDYLVNIGTAAGSGPTLTVIESYEGIEGAVVNILGGTIDVAASDDGINAANSDLADYAFAINISGGTTTVNAGGDGLDSNGDINVSGGTTVVFSSTQNDNNAIDYGDFGSSWNWTGGTLVGIGMNGMQGVPTSGVYVAFGVNAGGMGGVGGPGVGGAGGPGQDGGTRGGRGGSFGLMDDASAAEGTSATDAEASLLAGGPGQGGASGMGSQGGPGQMGASGGVQIAAGSTVEVRDASGATVFSTTAPKAANSLIMQADALGSGAEYTLYVNGSAIATATAAGQNAQTGGQEQPVATTFADVVPGKWYYQVVEQANTLGYMTGVGTTGLFRPNATLTRAEAIEVIYKMAYGQASAQAGQVYDTPFSDVGGSAWYAHSVQWGAEQGIVKGYNGTDEFRPNAPITRQEFATMLARYVLGGDVPAADASVLARYADGDQVATWARDAIAWAVQAGVIGDNAQLAPVVNVTRAEAAKMAVTVQPAA